MVESVRDLWDHWFVTNKGNRQVFPLYSDVERLPSKNSAFARIRQKCAEYKEREAGAIDGSEWHDFSAYILYLYRYYMLDINVPMWLVFLLSLLLRLMSDNVWYLWCWNSHLVTTILWHLLLVSLLVRRASLCKHGLFSLCSEILFTSVFEDKTLR